MKIMSLYLVLVLLISACANCGDGNRNEQAAKESNEQKEVMNEEQADFLVETAAGGMLEVEMSKLAVDQAFNVKVKSFAKMMVQDHEALNSEVKELAAKKNITLPTLLDSAQQKHISDMKRLSGRDFDRKYLEHMQDGHEKTIRKFEDASENHKDTEVQVFAAKSLPKLRAHLDSVKMLRNALK